MRDTAWRVAARHPDWGGALAGYFQQRAASLGQSSEELQQLQERLTQFAGNPAIQQQLGGMLHPATQHEVRVCALRAMAASRREGAARGVACAAGRRHGPRRPRHRATRRRRGPFRASLGIGVNGLAGGAAARRARPVPALGRPPRRPGLAEKGPPAGGRGPIRAPAVQPRSGATRRASHGGRLDCREGTARSRSADGLRRPGAAGRPARGAAPAARLRSRRRRGPWVGDARGSEQSPGRSNVRPDVLRPRLAKYPPAVQARGEALLASLQADSVKQARASISSSQAWSGRRRPAWTVAVQQPESRVRDVPCDRVPRRQARPRPHVDRADSQRARPA